MPAGGYQKPGSPAPASGPGRLARRTDGGAAQPIRSLPNAQYGEAAEYRTLQQSAPLAAAPSVPSSRPVSSGGSGAGGAPLTGLGEPSARPEEPITAGLDMGAGPGSEVLGLPDQNADLRARLYAIYSRFPTEDLRELIEQME